MHSEHFIDIVTMEMMSLTVLDGRSVEEGKNLIGLECPGTRQNSRILIDRRAVLAQMRER
jgi:hypothetical protein